MVVGHTLAGMPQLPYWPDVAPLQLVAAEAASAAVGFVVDSLPFAAVLELAVDEERLLVRSAMLAAVAAAVAPAVVAWSLAVVEVFADHTQLQVVEELQHMLRPEVPPDMQGGQVVRQDKLVRLQGKLALRPLDIQQQQEHLLDKQAVRHSWSQAVDILADLLRPVLEGRVIGRED